MTKMLRGKLVNIRPLDPNDLDWFTEWNNDPDYKGPFEPLEVNTREEVDEWYNSEKKAEWWVITDKQETPVGQLVTGPQGDYYWLGYILHPYHRNKGYTTEAVRLLVGFLFQSTDTVRVQAECNPENHASVQVLKKAGFTYEGLKRKAIFIQGRYMDSAMYSILRDEHYL
jgi:ribosomal-protein-alanine N-acetyltransferase